MRTHEEMTVGGKVSIWVGGIETDEDLLSYVDDGQFGADFDFIISPDPSRELAADLVSQPISDLVVGFSSWRSFAATCVQRAFEIGLKDGKCMVVLYSFDYEPSSAVNPDAPLKFVGSFDFA